MREQCLYRGSNFYRGLIARLLGGFIGISAHSAFAQSTTAEPHDQLYEFHIPSGPLETAIAAFTRQTHTSVLFDAGLVRNREAHVVDGLFTYPSALEALLNGTGIGVRYADDKSFVLVETINAAADTQSGLVRKASISLGTLHIDAPADFSFYSSILVADLQRALSRKASLRTLSFFVRANLWVDRAGRVEHAELSRSTGDKGRDESVVQALGEFAISKPPPVGLPQPVQVSINIQRL
ncbi:TonB family protein [Rhizomicrobium palustre]|uniref:TonB family protein n=1 Tax=Rhizomicrobium palustre TaxID=189966 RepID=A0A846N135_9PROT|nr:TonB family protein [Rhizomicrobium palustre]NIK88952.1 TonB family protein [Rhizomicrobium palustre]